MSIPKHHAEWLSLLEISGPFLSMPVLLNAFPQGLDAVNPEQAQELGAVYEEWLDNQGGLSPNPAIHRAWIDYVLQSVLEFSAELLAEGQGIPAGLRALVSEHHETVRPDLVLRDPEDGTAYMLIQHYPPGQDLENAVPGRPWKASPATRMMELLHATEVRLGLVTNGEQWLLVQAKRGESTGFVSWYAGLWVEERLTLCGFQSLLGVHRFFGVPAGEMLVALLDESVKDQHEVTTQLGQQVRHAVELLVQAVDRADRDRGQTLLKGISEALLYEAALTVMMRLVFLLAAEERGLLLLGDPIYDQNYAVSTARGQLREMADRQGEEVLERRYDAWPRLLATFRAVYGGIAHEDLRLLAYGGSLFDPDRFPFLEGRLSGTRWLESAPRTAAADPLPINNRTVLYLLEALQVLRVSVPGGGKTARTLSFRALDIEQIGHVYEGLLDHQAVRANSPAVSLQGAKDKEPEIALDVLEAKADENALLKLLQEQTGRSENALRNGLKATLDPFRAQRLRAACENDDALYQRVLPFAGLVRDDDYGYPVVIPAGSVYVTTGATRRATGTHYTPRSLTEPIVQHTLEPLVYIGPAEGKPPAEWRLRSPAEILALKVCDMAMGSGAFLVQACRYLSERLVEAWEEKLSSLTPLRDLQITPEGNPATGDPAETIIPANDQERLALARRLVVDRCLYGVDKNPLAVEMAKLSLWLITLDKNRPFTFLDHALRHGDSLVGADEEMFLRWSQSLKEVSGPLYFEENQAKLVLARQKRQALQAFTVVDVRDAQEKARLLAEAEAASARIKLGCDLIIGVRLRDDLTANQQEDLLARLLIEYTAKQMPVSPDARRALADAQGQAALHWPFEFPEVFAGGGFSAFVGNPPFMGGLKVYSEYGAAYREYIVNFIANGVRAIRGAADLCAYFLLRADSLIHTRGTLGFVTTNTIAQGDTLVVGLEQILDKGKTSIYRAISSFRWPGQAVLEVSNVWLFRGSWQGESILDHVTVEAISSALTEEGTVSGKPWRLNSSQGIAFVGSMVAGKGFVLSEAQAQSLTNANPNNRQVLFPYLNGMDLNSRFDQSPSRWVIQFDEMEVEEARAYTEVWDLAFSTIKPERMQKDGKKYPRMVNEWWKHYSNRQDLYRVIEPLDKVLVRTRVTQTHAFALVSGHMIFSDALVVIASDNMGIFAVLQSTFQEKWAWRYGSTLKTDLRYSLAICFETFSFPKPKNAPMAKSLVQTGENYYSYRQSSMIERLEGLTDTYNRFHDQAETAQDIARLRALHVEMDHAVAAAYGWDDLDLGHGFHETQQGLRYTISEPARRTVLARLLKLNHERYEEEVRLGLHEKKGSSRKDAITRTKDTKSDEGQMSLF